VRPKASTLSRRVTLLENRIPDEPRAALRRGAAGADHAFEAMNVRIGDVPLFRRGPTGELEQCVRVVLRVHSPLGPVQLCLEQEGRTFDTVKTDLTAGEHTIRLFLPEVSVQTATQMRIGDAVVPHVVEPQRKWRVFVVHHSHLDIGYTDPQAIVMRNHLAYLDAVLDLAAVARESPDDAQFRWTVEANWPLQRWLDARPPAACDELLRLVREGRVEVSALPMTFNSEALSVDELARQLTFADRFRELAGVPVDAAMQTDVPGGVLGLPGILAASGVRFLSVAHNYAARAVPSLTGGDELPRLFYWGAPAGKRVLVWQTGSPQGVAYLEGNLLGLHESSELTEQLLPEYLAGLATSAFPYGASEALGAPEGASGAPFAGDVLHLRVQGAIADNAAPSLVPAEVVRAWNERWAYPELRSATNREFFLEAEQRLGDSLQTLTGDWTSWWADGIGSGARALGWNRRAQAAIRAAQTLHAVTGNATAAGEDVARAYESMAHFDEHTWLAANPGGDAAVGRASAAVQWQAKSELAADALRRSEDLVDSGVARLAHLAAPRAGSAASFLVLNASSWPRTDRAEVFVPSSRVALDRALAVVDAETGARVPHAVVVRDAGRERNRPPGRFVSLLARDVPPVGYRRYELVDADEPDEGLFVAPQAPLVNEHYRVELDHRHGAVERLLDRDLGCDLVDASSAFGLAQYVHDVYLPAGRATLRQAPGGPQSEGAPAPGQRSDWLVGSRSLGDFGTIVSRTSNAVEESVTIRLAGEGTAWIETTFRLVRGVKRLDIEHRLHKLPVTEKESVYFVFPFALTRPAVELEVTGGVDVPAGRLPGSARHLQALRHWATLQDERATVAWGTLEAALVQVGNIHLPFPPYSPTLDDAGAATLVSWAMNNVWDTNFPASQQGETVFSYAVSSGPPSAGRALGMEVGAALSRPLVGVLAAREGARVLDAAAASFCTVDPVSVEVVLVSESRSGHDLAIVLHSLAPDEIEAQLRFPALDVKAAFAGSFLERDLQPVWDGSSAKVRIAPGELVAVALALS
jgi:hypothetical protein